MDAYLRGVLVSDNDKRWRSFNQHGGRPPVNSIWAYPVEFFPACSRYVDVKHHTDVVRIVREVVVESPLPQSRSTLSPRLSPDESRHFRGRRPLGAPHSGRTMVKLICRAPLQDDPALRHRRERPLGPRDLRRRSGLVPRPASRTSLLTCRPSISSQTIALYLDSEHQARKGHPLDHSEWRREVALNVRPFSLRVLVPRPSLTAMPPSTTVLP